MPAYLRDLFGPFQVGAIHGRLLTAWSAAGIAGPLIINGILDTQGEPGTLTADNYTPALLTMVRALAVGFVANLLIRPVADRFHESGSDHDSAVPRGATATTGEGRDLPGPGAAWLPIAWVIVGVPLLYGVYKTVTVAFELF